MRNVNKVKLTKEQARTLGSLLGREAQEEAKRRFVSRYTGDHKPAWVNVFSLGGTSGRISPLQFKDDADWLSHTVFRINRDGSLHASAPCESSPTWPNNPELRKQ